MEFEFEANEEDYVVYASEPDHKEMGSVLKKAYTKELKEKIGKLSREEIITYLKEKKLTINGVEI